MNDGTKLGPRPADPSSISFDRHCFEVVGTVDEYVVSCSSASYPKRFATREAADAYARKTQRTVTVVPREVRRRISWA